MINEVRKLEDEIRGTGDMKHTVFTKIFEGKRCYMYKAMGYEVFLKRTVQCCDWIDDKPIPNGQYKERYPKSEDFGKWAWCYKNYDNALKQFERLETMSDEMVKTFV